MIRLITFCCGIFVALQTAGRLDAQFLPPGAHVESGQHSLDDDAIGCSLAAHNADFAHVQLLQSSGDQALDAAISQELTVLRGAFQANPFFALYSGSASNNAFATPPDGTHPNGKVVFGLAMMSNELRQTGSSGFTIPIIMAHEFGHILQFQHGIHLSSKYQELQADYMAGWFLGNREQNVQGGMRAVAGSANRFFTLGDYAFNAPTHHGTPQERKAAILEGFSIYQMTLADAFARSTVYINQMSRQEHGE